MMWTCLLPWRVHAVSPSHTEDLEALLELAERGEDVRPLLSAEGRAWLDRELLAALVMDECPELAEDDARDWADLAQPILAGNDLTLREIGAILGCTAEGARQIIDTAFQRIRSRKPAAAHRAITAVREIEDNRPLRVEHESVGYNLGGTRQVTASKKKAAGWRDPADRHHHLFVKS